jgi:hypothetical protein
LAEITGGLCRWARQMVLDKLPELSWPATREEAWEAAAPPRAGLAEELARALE